MTGSIVYSNLNLKYFKWQTHPPWSSGTLHPFTWLSLKSATLTSKGNSGIQTVKRARPVYVPYLTTTEALEDPRISEPST